MRSTDVLMLAIEVGSQMARAIDHTREPSQGGSRGMPSIKLWAIDCLRRLPDDREDARLIVRSFDSSDAGEWTPAELKRARRLCREYMKQLETAGLMDQGLVYLRKMR